MIKSNPDPNMSFLDRTRPGPKRDKDAPKYPILPLNYSSPEKMQKGNSQSQLASDEKGV